MVISFRIGLRAEEALRVGRKAASLAFYPWLMLTLSV